MTVVFVFGKNPQNLRTNVLGMYAHTDTYTGNPDKPMCNQNDCRERAIYCIRNAARVNTGEDFILSIDARKSLLETCKKIINVFGLPFDIYYKNRYYFIGKIKDFREFNYAISFLLFVLKFDITGYSFFDEDTVKTELIHENKNDQGVMVSFAWYLAFVKKFKDFSLDVHHPLSITTNGISSYVKSILFYKHPQLFQEFKKYVKKVRFAEGLCIDYDTELYVNIGAIE